MDPVKTGSDPKQQQNGSSNGSSTFWTNEKHMHFLSAMEATFVRRVLLSNNSAALDRHVPDVSDSTRDIRRPKLNHQLHITAPRCTPTTGVSGLNPTARDGDRQRRRHPSHAHKSPHDQVVPQLVDRASEKAERNP